MFVAGFLVEVILRTLHIFSLLLLVRVLLSWFPGLPWENPLLAALASITDPYLNLIPWLDSPFRRTGPFSNSGIPHFKLGDHPAEPP